VVKSNQLTIFGSDADIVPEKVYELKSGTTIKRDTNYPKDYAIVLKVGSDELSFAVNAKEEYAEWFSVLRLNGCVDTDDTKTAPPPKASSESRGPKEVVPVSQPPSQPSYQPREPREPQPQQSLSQSFQPRQPAPQQQQFYQPQQPSHNLSVNTTFVLEVTGVGFKDEELVYRISVVVGDQQWIIYRFEAQCAEINKQVHCNILVDFVVYQGTKYRQQI
jgi:hypothetical protein